MKRRKDQKSIKVRHWIQNSKRIVLTRETVLITRVAIGVRIGVPVKIKRVEEDRNRKARTRVHLIEKKKT